MLNDLATILRAHGLTATPDEFGAGLIVGDEFIACSMTGKVYSTRDGERFTLGTVRDGADALAASFVANLT